MKRMLWIILALGVAGCTAVKPLQGGKATTSRSATGVVEQTVVQSENPSQSSRQDQETVRTRSYTVPTGSRLEELRVFASEAGAVVTNVQAVVLSAPMPVIEREETRAKTELGAAQKDTARELGAKLSSLKGIVWVGVAMFVFGLPSEKDAPVGWRRLKSPEGTTDIPGSRETICQLSSSTAGRSAGHWSPENP